MPPRGAPRGEGARGGPPGRGGPPRGGGPPGGRGGGPAAVPPSFRGRGGPPARGGAPAGRGGGSAGAGTALVPGIVPGYDIETIGVRRPGRGTAGRALKVFTNHYSTTIPEEMIYHYDGSSCSLRAVVGGSTDRQQLVRTATRKIRHASKSMLNALPVIGSGDNKFPVGLNIDIIKSLQQTVAPAVFTPRAVYDGRKNMFAPRRLPFSGGGDTAEVREHVLARNVGLTGLV
jgi:eukaryotic translation initiation factor 2C